MASKQVKQKKTGTRKKKVRLSDLPAGKARAVKGGAGDTPQESLSLNFTKVQF